MSDARSIYADNAAVLRQGAELIKSLDGKHFAGAGPQVRHVIDFYRCFLRGLAGRKIDYTCRERNPDVEREPEVAVAGIETLIERLDALSPASADTELLVRVEQIDDSEDAPTWSRSSLLRELQFLMSHTIHHYALIRSILQGEGIEVAREFGIAPSTLRHWNRLPVPAE